MRRLQRKITCAVLSLAAAAASIGMSSDAEACGGCFIGETENTQVSAHRMAFSLSQTETTLWDQIEYAGDPASFAWVLPIKGTVEVGLSSDLLFERLQALTTVQIQTPQMCPPPPWCHAMTSTSTATGVGSGTGTGVGVLVQETVGPFETVQLETTDPDALTDWLTANGYAIDAAVEPVIDAYVNEGFNFLAMKLAPGQGVDAMRPVRITTPGASLGLPLRMVAAGTGATVPIRLWVVGEGRYEAANFPNLLIDEQDLVWDFATSSSNYSELVQQAYASVNGAGWLTTASVPMSKSLLTNNYLFDVEYDPENSGYGDAMGNGAVAEATEDIGKLLGNITGDTPRLTRLDAELPQSALANDLTLTASLNQDEVSRTYLPQNIENANCPEYPPCDETMTMTMTVTTTMTSSGTGTSMFPMPSGDGASADEDDGGCSVGHNGGAPTALIVVGIGAALGIARRRRRR